MKIVMANNKDFSRITINFYTIDFYSLVIFKLGFSV